MSKKDCAFKSKKYNRTKRNVERKKKEYMNVDIEFYSFSAKY